MYRRVRRCLSFPGPLHTASALGRATVFFLKVLPMLPSRPVDWFTPTPRVERHSYPVGRGTAETDIYLPGTRGPHPGVMISLGIVPFGVEHPQVPRLGEALARAGFATLMHWSPAMRDRRLHPQDIADIALAYQWLVRQPFADRGHSGLLGTCVGGSFALMAAAHPAIRDQVGFVAAFAPYSSMWTFARDIASASRDCAGALGYQGRRVPWAVDPLTRDVYVRTLTATLDPPEMEILRRLFAREPSLRPGAVEAGHGGGFQRHGIHPANLSERASSVHRLLSGPDTDSAEAELRALPPEVRRRFDDLSPLAYLSGIRAPLILIGHDRDDAVIPVSESRRLRAALADRPGVHYTEFGLFQHADPTKRKLAPHRLAYELARFFGWVYPLFQMASTASPRRV